MFVVSLNMADKQELLALLGAGCLKEARELGVTLCAQSPEDTEVWFLLAGVQAQLGDMDEVIRCCRQVVTLDPGNSAARFNLSVALQMRRSFKEAAEGYRGLLAIQPDTVPVLANLGLVLRELGDLEEANRYCRRALELHPDLPEVRNTLGLLFMDQGEYGQAIDWFRQAVTSRPGYAEAHFNLGLCRQRTGSNFEAHDCFRAAIKFRPDYFEAHCSLAGVLVALGKVPDAVLCYERAIRIRPDAAQVHRDLGALLASQRRWNEAIPHYRRAVELKPDFADACYELGNALLDADPDPRNIREASEWFSRALRHKPESVEIHLSLALTLTDLGRVSEAETHYRRALELKPDTVLATAGLASLLEHNGDFEQAFALVKPMVDAGTDNLYIVLAYAALAGRFDCRAEASTRLVKMLQQPRDVQQQADGHFALGKLYDEMQDYPQAFEHYRRANSFARMPFDESQYRRDFDSLIATFAPGRMRRRARASNRSKRPVFIVGMPRSGTSLTEQILASHPVVYGAGELPDITDIARGFPAKIGSAKPYPHCYDDLTPRNCDIMAQRYLDRLTGLSSDAERVVDKMPHNFLFLGLIDILFPGARVIHCLRDPIDTCLSIYFQPFNANFKKLHPYASDLRSLGRYYRQYMRLMDHWRRVMRIPMLELRYEELVADQEAMSRKLVEFCELDWDDRCLRFHETARLVKTASYDQVRRPMYRKSVARWKRYEQFLGPLTEALEIDAASRS